MNNDSTKTGYSASEALLDRGFKMERVKKIDEIVLKIRGSKLSSEEFDGLLDNSVAELDIKLAQAEEQLYTFNLEKSSQEDLKFKK